MGASSNSLNANQHLPQCHDAGSQQAVVALTMPEAIASQ
jgi:hypothetical protein